MKSVKRNALVVAFLFATVAGVANSPKKAFNKKASEVEKELITIEADPVFKKKGNTLLVIEKAFNFENAFRNDYTVMVVDNNETFKETVEVK